MRLVDSLKAAGAPVPVAIVTTLLACSAGGTSGALASDQKYPKPGLTPAGVESAFIANQSDYYIYTVIYAYDDQGDAVADGGAGVGFGLGSSKDLVALQIGYNYLGFREGNRGGTVDAKLARDLVDNESLRISLGAGALGLIGHGKGSDDGVTPFVVASLAAPVEISSVERAVQINLGYGGGKFQEVQSPIPLQEGFFGSIGLELADNVGVSAGWAGKGLNTTLSISPFKGIPIGINLSAENVTDYEDLGRAYSLSLTWGSSFRSPF